MSLLIKIDREKKEALFRQIVNQISRMIEDGSLPPGARLPASRKLAQILALDRSTVLNAYAELQALGYLRSRQGSYTTVSLRRKKNAQVKLREPDFDWAALTNEESEQVYRGFMEYSMLVRQPAEQTKMLDLASIELDPRLYPMDHLRTCLRQVMAEKGAEALRYGHPAGLPDLRLTLARRMRLHGITVSAREILICNGAQQGLDLIMRVLGGKGRSVALESPTYASILPLLQLNRLSAVGIQMKEDGIDLEELETTLKKRKPLFIYTMPSFQNPTGLTAAHAKREKLLDLACKYRTPVVEDGFEDDMKYEGPVPLPIKSIDSEGLVIYLGTFSKTLFPGLRIGWITAGRTLIDRLAAAKRFSDLGSGTLDQMLLDRFCRLGFYDLHLQRMHRVMRKRMRRALQAAGDFFPPKISWTRPQGGYTIWVRLPESFPARVLHDCAREENLLVSAGGIFFPGNRPSEFVRLSIARLNEAEIVTAFYRLSLVWRKLLSPARIRPGTGL